MLLSNTVFNEYKDSIDTSVFPKELQGIYRVLQSHHMKNDGDLSVDDLANLFFATNPKDREFYLGVFENLRSINVTETSTRELIKGLRRNKLLREMSLLSYEVAEGRTQFEKLQKLLSELDQTQEEIESDKDDFEFVTTDLDKLIERTYSQVGLRWRLTTLNRILGSLRKGNFGFVFARPETGKTTFLASEITFMVSQLKEEDGPIVWLNNEEVGENVMLRLYQALFGETLVNVMRNRREFAKRFQEITKGKLLMVDRADISKTFVEKLCAKFKPSLLIFDQIDKIKGFSNDREDLLLGSIYQWAREIAKQYCPVVGVCQADGTGENVKWLNMGHVANAKTSKQAEADWILGIGKTHQMGYENIRYLNVSKNKLVGDEDSDPTARHAQKEVIIRADIARYEDIHG